MAMESVKAYIIGWLDWGANYVKDDPEDFFSKCKSLFSVKDKQIMLCPNEV